MSRYDYEHTKLRRELLRECGGLFSKGRYTGGAFCQKCRWIEWVKGKRSRLELAHLDGNIANRNKKNLRLLCVPCHKAHDRKRWLPRIRWTWAGKNDRKRPLLQGVIRV